MICPFNNELDRPDDRADFHIDLILCGLIILVLCIVAIWIQLRDRSGDSAHKARESVEAKQ